MLQKFAGPLVGAPVRPNMLNMPKSASGPSRVLNPNGILIGAAVFAGLTSVTD